MEKKSSVNASSQKTCTCRGTETNESKGAFEGSELGGKEGKREFRETFYTATQIYMKLCC